jgi:microcystin-dependent protein
VSLLTTQSPAHSHTPNCSSGQTTTQPEGAYWGAGGRGAAFYASTANVNLAVNAVASTGGNQPHDNMQPYLGMTYIIALEGLFPSRP